jgi:hypothetical protein
MPAFEIEAQPEYRGPARAVTFESTGLRWPEDLGPFSEIPGQDYGSPGMPRIGAIEPLLDPATRDRERADCERRAVLRQQVEQAALAAARDAMTAHTLSAQVFEGVSEAVEKAVAAPPGKDDDGRLLPADPPKPRRPHRRVNPKPDASEDLDKSKSATEPEPAETPEDTA